MNNKMSDCSDGLQYIICKYGTFSVKDATFNDKDGISGDKDGTFSEKNGISGVKTPHLMIKKIKSIKRITDFEIKSK